MSRNQFATAPSLLHTVALSTAPAQNRLPHR